ncbi:TPA: translesion error-prone DNA polymerase V autoproteolytic subunit [Legionella pneumophila]|uniref:Translesion error-prone DNA polymerase V autoproteolytic subunit n=3 Tax=Legionella pneumophila TaxID=446 RepID=A0AAN5T9Y9_LEGPN|nr:DNA polymerase V [Legionella pneumophila]TIH04510.1 DNA polymerase V [Legionella pneumophila]HAT7003349.1 translesion error-prone DNA polymerase V autoproteolytic subunit [Legionella pneumophila]HAT7742099.1 translesion error-prone DNA polymerase V autoproteolytic subunit [Legionella pneumophila]HAT7937207.1 translesion error-prone DNA polymerase V autoproteolytic subunit [Legionella pneumophila]
MIQNSRLGEYMSHGGARAGAGRPRGQGKYGEATRSVRIPESRIQDVMKYLQGEKEFPAIPLYTSSVRAGFPSPGDDYIESMLDLNEYLIKHPASTFFVRASGESMINAGIYSGDILIVDRGIEATHGKIVIVALNGELTVKRLSRQHGQVKLLAENPDFPPIDITEEYDMVIWGVVTHVIHTVL